MSLFTPAGLTVGCHTVAGSAAAKPDDPIQCDFVLYIKFLRCTTSHQYYFTGCLKNSVTMSLWVRPKIDLGQNGNNITIPQSYTISIKEG